MSGGQIETPAQRQLQPGPENRYANAAGNPKLTQKKRGRHNHVTPYSVTTAEGDRFGILLIGRDRWALEQLRRAGPRGCTPFDNPAPRWSAYVFNLRGKGVEIETIYEPHGGNFPGHHGRYVLRCGVSPGWKGGAL